MEIIANLKDYLPLYQVDVHGKLIKWSSENSNHSHQLPNVYSEGGIQEITQELRIRDPKLRIEALQYYENICYICEQDYSKLYGNLGISFLEVHHKIPISDGVRENSVTDVCLVCANCHRMIHSIGKDGIPIDELREIIKENKEKSN